MEEEELSHETNRPYRQVPPQTDYNTLWESQVSLVVLVDLWACASC